MSLSEVAVDTGRRTWLATPRKEQALELWRLSYPVATDPCTSTTLDETGLVGSPSEPRDVLCLTIACHHDPTRIGERALLDDTGKPVVVSRGRTLFGRPDNGPKRPLRDPFLTRRPLTLKPGREGVVVDATNRPIIADGEPLSGRREYSLGQLSLGGAILELSNRVTLLLHTAPAHSGCHAPPLIGWSRKLHQLQESISSVASDDCPVLILGESGVGKELVAHAIHERSRRRHRSCVAVNMATLTESTAVSTLFGHEKGAYTGATRRHRGLFEQANGGTLFLDEIGDTPSAVQAMLLRVLETGEVAPLGKERPFEVDVRIVAATDRDLVEAARDGSFRTTLIHRLAAHTLHVPTLRERREDIPLLFVSFLRRALMDLGRESWLEPRPPETLGQISSSVMFRLLTSTFPGNVRELRNLATQVAPSCKEREQLKLPDWSSGSNDSCDGDSRVKAEPPTSIDEATLEAALAANGWSPDGAAAYLGISSSTIHYLMKRGSRFRRAVDIGDAELAAALERYGGDLVRTSDELRVSLRALRIRLGRLQSS